ncbi:MAG: ribbon-helix-helix domain-containing protein [Pseudomonadota bacterium]
MTQPKKRRLSDALAEPDAPAPEPQAAPARANDAPAPSRRQDRQGRKMISGWFPLTVSYELEELRLERSRALGRRVTLQELQAEAYNDLFKKYGRPELAPTKEG